MEAEEEKEVDKEEDKEGKESDDELEPPEIPGLKIDPPPKNGINTSCLGHVVKKRRILEGRSLHGGNKD